MRWLLLCLLLLGPAAAFAGPSAEETPAVLVADSVRVEGEERLIASGAVEVLYRDTRLRAARITYDRRGGRLLIEGPITLVEGERAVIIASAAELSDDLRNGILRSARMVLDDQVQLAAASIRRVDGRYTELNRSVVSSCRICANNSTPLWELRAARVIHDAEARQLWFENASFRFAGVPLLWLPRLRLPDPTVERATGLLVPQIRTTSQLGAGLKLPYFATIGPSRDLLLTPYLSPRTRTLELRYRQALRDGRLAFSGAITRDQIRPGRNRGYLFGSGEIGLPAGFNLDFGIETTSDPAYLLDYGYSGKDRLTSFLRAERIRRNERIVASVLSFRTLRADEIPISDQLPTLLAQATWERRLPGLWGGEGHWSVGAAGLLRRSHLDGPGRDLGRIDAEAGWQRRWLFGPGIDATITSRLDASAYAIAEDSSFPHRLTRVTPAVAATLRWPLAKTLRDGSVSVIEPLVQIAWSRSHGDLPPDEDSTLVEFDEANLLSLDRYPGVDRREQGPRAVIGLNWTRLGTDWQTGLSFGRIYHADRQDFSVASGLRGGWSDWLIAGRLSWGGRLAATGRLLLDDSLAMTKAEARLDFTGETTAIAAGYAHVVADPAEGRSSDIDELTLDGRWEMNRHFVGSAGVRYDLDLDRAGRADFGLTYRNECLSVDLSLSRRFTSSASVEPTTSVALSLSLNGFGTDGRQWRRSCRS